MADEKRKFYNTGDAKGFTKARFFEVVLELANGNEIEDADAALVAAAAEYELEGLKNKTKAPSGEAKDRLDSDYAKGLRAAVIPIVGNEFKSAQELSDALTAKGILAPSGKAYVGTWIAQVLKDANLATREDGKYAGYKFVVGEKVVTTTSAKTGLKTEHGVAAYKRG